MRHVIVSLINLYNLKNIGFLTYFQSIIIPIHNGEKWINNCFNAILQQSAIGLLSLEICVCNDASTDRTLKLLDEWKHVFNQKEIPLQIYNNASGVPQGGMLLHADYIFI